MISDDTISCLTRGVAVAVSTMVGTLGKFSTCGRHDDGRVMMLAHGQLLDNGGAAAEGTMVGAMGNDVNTRKAQWPCH